MSRGEHKASKRRIEAAERQRKALELKKMGQSYEAIAIACGYAGRSGAYKAVAAALAEITREPAEDVLKLELERLDRVLLAVWERARDGDLAAIDRVLRITQQRMALVGFDVKSQMAIEEHQILRKRVEALEQDREAGQQSLPPRAKPAAEDGSHSGGDGSV